MWHQNHPSHSPILKDPVCLELLRLSGPAVLEDTEEKQNGGQQRVVCLSLQIWLLLGHKLKSPNLRQQTDPWYLSKTQLKPLFIVETSDRSKQVWSFKTNKKNSDLVPSWCSAPFPLRFIWPMMVPHCFPPESWPQNSERASSAALQIGRRSALSEYSVNRNVLL